MELRDQNGFTLTEITVTLVILGVLVGLAMPSYRNTVEQSRSNEARANLNIIFMAERIYFLNTNQCYPPGATDANLATINQNLGTDITSQFYTISITANNNSGSVLPNAANFTATASRNNAGAKTFAITTAGNIVEAGNYS